MRPVAIYGKKMDFRHERGFTMIELMISITIGLLLVSAMLMAFVSSARSYRMQEAMSEVQENGRYALSLIQKNLRQSGIGQPDKSAVQGVVNNDTKISNFELNESDLIITAADVESEIVFLRGLDTDGLAYYIGNTGVGRVSLYQNKTAVVEGVTALAMEYGIDRDNDQLVDNYLGLNKVADTEWDDVIAARFSLLVSSSDSGVSDYAQKLPAPFAAIDTSDRRLYQVYTATVLLRNALL